jgi:signal transduction histidine kinase
MDGRSGRVLLSTSALPNGLVRIAVADTGPGIPAERLDRLFEQPVTTKATGTGIGLALVHQLVAELGGEVRVESKVGEGTTVTVDLPAG